LSDARGRSQACSRSGWSWLQRLCRPLCSSYWLELQRLLEPLRLKRLKLERLGYSCCSGRWSYRSGSSGCRLSGG